MSQMAEHKIGKDDGGFGLIELIVAMAIGGLIIAAIVFVLVGSWQTQRDVTTVNEATKGGQIVASAIERAVRNGDAIIVTNGDGVSVPSGSMLLVHTTLGDAIDDPQTCQGFDFADEATRVTTTASDFDSATWGDLRAGIITQSEDDAGSDIPFFQTDGVTVTYAFTIETDSTPVKFAGEVSARNPTGTSAPCWG